MNIRSILVNEKPTINYHNGLHFMKSNNIEITVLKWGFTYEEMLYDYITTTKKTQTDFLKLGLKQIFKAIPKVKDIELESIESITKRNYDQNYNPENWGKYPKLQNEEDYLKQINFFSNNEFEKSQANKDYALTILQFESLRFETKLSELGIKTIKDKNDIIFKKRKGMKKGKVNNIKIGDNAQIIQGSNFKKSPIITEQKVSNNKKENSKNSNIIVKLWEYVSNNPLIVGIALIVITAIGVYFGYIKQL